MKVVNCKIAYMQSGLFCKIVWEASFQLLLVCGKNIATKQGLPICIKMSKVVYYDKIQSVGHTI